MPDDEEEEKKQPDLSKDLTVKELDDLSSSFVITTIGSVNPENKPKQKSVPLIPISGDKVFTDYKGIYISYGGIPINMRNRMKIPEWRKEILYILGGECVHEAGHWELTLPLENFYKAWEKDTAQGCDIGHLITNIVEDSRINWKFIYSHRYGIGKNLGDMCALMARCWVYTNEMEAKKGQAKAGTKWEGIIKKIDVVNYANLKGLYAYWEQGEDISKRVDQLLDAYYPNTPKEWRDDIDAAAKLIRKARTYSDPQSLEFFLIELLKIFIKYGETKRSSGEGRGGGDGEGGGKIIEGGSFDPGDMPAPYGTKPIYLPGDDPLAKEIEAAIEEREKAEAAKGTGTGFGAAKGTGEDIEAPNPNEIDYLQRRERLAVIINKILDKLKFDARPVFVPKDYVRSGKLMPGVLAKAIVASYRQPVENIYRRNQIKMEKTETTLALVTDLSGSTDMETMKDVFCVIAEVCGHWLPDESFSLFTYGSGFQKVKTFSETYESTRYRIGGIGGMGGTELGQPMFKIREMFKRIKHKPGRKVLIVVSDFELYGDDYSRSHTEAELFKKELDVDTICIANSPSGRNQSSAVSGAKRVSDHVVDMPSIDMLPDQFIAIYKALAFSSKGGIEMKVV